MDFLWPLKVDITEPVDALQRRIDPSAYPTANESFWGERSMHVTSARWPVSCHIAVFSKVSQISKSICIPTYHLAFFNIPDKYILQGRYIGQSAVVFRVRRGATNQPECLKNTVSIWQYNIQCSNIPGWAHAADKFGPWLALSPKIFRVAKNKSHVPNNFLMRSRVSRSASLSP